jgi:type III secretory pathway lipoprotein EscJ
MKKYFDKRLMGVFLMIFVFFTAACEAEAAKSLRQKSSVLLVFNNIAGTRYDEKLTQIALEKLQKKIEGIYLEIDAEPYVKTSKKSHSKKLHLQN